MQYVSNTFQSSATVDFPWKKSSYLPPSPSQISSLASSPPDLVSVQPQR